jgi:hypothetical protein
MKKRGYGYPKSNPTIMSSAPKRVRKDVMRGVRLSPELDRQLRLLIEQRGSNFNRELKEALLAHLAVHA